MVQVLCLLYVIGIALTTFSLMCRCCILQDNVTDPGNLYTFDARPLTASSKCVEHLTLCLGFQAVTSSQLTVNHVDLKTSCKLQYGHTYLSFRFHQLVHHVLYL